MSEESSFWGTLKSIPVIIYDLIVYYASSILLFSAVILLFVTPKQAHEMISEAQTAEIVFISLVGLSLAYVWGQFSTTFSYYLIKKPVGFLVKRFGKKQKEDFFFDYPWTLEPFRHLTNISSKVKGNYWTLIYHIRLTHSDIADDLIKRYAKCKLARVNAFNSFILFALVVWIKISGVPSVIPFYFPSSNGYFIIASLSIVLVILFALEFFQRQCWFGDIMIKIYSAIPFKSPDNSPTPKP